MNTASCSAVSLARWKRSTHRARQAIASGISLVVSHSNGVAITFRMEASESGRESAANRIMPSMTTRHTVAATVALSPTYTRRMSSNSRANASRRSTASRSAFSRLTTAILNPAASSFDATVRPGAVARSTAPTDRMPAYTAAQSAHHSRCALTAI